MNVMLDAGAYLPERAHTIDAGLDIRCPINVVIDAGTSCVVDTGVHVQIPRGFVGMIKSKSGLNVLHGIVTEGVIDAGYTGSIRVKMYNHGDAPYTIMRGDKITQLVVLPVYLTDVVEVYEMQRTERGDGGFGSTGR